MPNTNLSLRVWLISRLIVDLRQRNKEEERKRNFPIVASYYSCHYANLRDLNRGISAKRAEVGINKTIWECTRPLTVYDYTMRNGVIIEIIIASWVAWIYLGILELHVVQWPRCYRDYQWLSCDLWKTTVNVCIRDTCLRYICMYAIGVRYAWKSRETTRYSRSRTLWFALITRTS